MCYGLEAIEVTPFNSTVYIVYLVNFKCLDSSDIKGVILKLNMAKTVIISQTQ